ncbi:hypothetical protein JR316_0010181 [Psilocybe cubensis]|nr:hypothetical protein JR316_0010181 [Psilocybe cubensis]KAH9477948.1 hypothetical protein JR316_0010181 [Psilocybe cubensis]
MVKVAKPKKICECDECNTKRLQSIFYDASAIMDSVSPEQFETIDPAWTQLLTSLGTFASIAEKVAELDSRAKLAVSAMTFAFKIVLEQVHRDAKIEELIRIIDDLYRFFLESKPMEKIALFKDTLQRILTQTAECAYFIATYRKLKHFVQRAVVNVVSNADSMISKFEVAFGELKIELILGTALQTAVVSFRILQKIESVENLLYLNNLPKLKAINWDSGKVCARGTRQNIIDDVVRWASASSPKETAQESRIYLLSGPQGCGKSAIAHTVAQAFHQQGRLGASVFLNGDAGEADSQRVCSSIAFELSGYDPTIRSQMADLLKADHSLAWADIGRQFPDLIVKATRNLLLIGPVLIVLDGLYEGLVPSEQHRLITALSLHCASLPPNFRILMTTRPHDSVMGTLKQAAHCHIHEIGFDDEGSMLDTSSYISQCLRSLFEKKPKLGEHYSAEELHDQFVTRAMGLHLWVSTINQALLSCGDGMEVSILSRVLSLRTPLSKEDTMDDLFRAIIGVIPYPNLAISTILGTFIKSTKPLSLSVLRQVAGDPFKDNECIVDIMRGLGCIIEKGRGREGTLLYGIHPSLEDFLTNDARCGDTGIVINPSLRNRSMAEACLDELNVSLKQNILCLDNVMALNEEIHDLSERIEKHIPQSLHYACLHWVPHRKRYPA